MLKVYIAEIIRAFFLLVSKLLKKKNCILFSSYSGKSFNCNPYYIYEYLSSLKCNNYKFIVVTKGNLSKNNNDNIKFVKYKSLAYHLSLLTSRILITNDYFPLYMPKTKGQFLFNTWHGGGAYKKVEAKNQVEVEIYKLLYSDTDYFLSSSEKFSDVMSSSLMINRERFVNTGMPRNDIFFDKHKCKMIKDKVIGILGLDKENVFILYAPTWRDDGRKIVEQITEETVIGTIEKILKRKVCLLLRTHYHTNDGICCNKRFVDVSEYSDMQELLCLADILITDYSSCMWDFSLMYKPCFIYATDIEQYKQDRDFYTPMSEWPFPIATNVNELMKHIKNFNIDTYVKIVKQHHETLGSYEDGNACYRVGKLIKKTCGI